MSCDTTRADVHAALLTTIDEAHKSLFLQGLKTSTAFLIAVAARREARWLTPVTRLFFGGIALAAVCIHWNPIAPPSAASRGEDWRSIERRSPRPYAMGAGDRSSGFSLNGASQNEAIFPHFRR